MEHDWPGNVRELRNAVEGACVLASGDSVLEDFEQLGPPPAARRATPVSRTPPRRPPAADASHSDAVMIPIGCTLAEAERRIVLASLRHHRSRARAARALGIGLRTLYTKLAAWGGDAEDAEKA
jgi:DNA-binding NtrC family response regulator